MKLFFWQNINSIHQSAFFSALVNVEGIEVTLIVTEKISEFRLGMGWELPAIEGLSVIELIEEDSGWQDLINLNSNNNVLHVFSGINAFPKVHNAFLHAIKKGCKVGVFTEPLDFRGLKGFLRNLRGYYYSLKYQKKIALVLVTGKLGYKQFKNWGYNESKLFEWSYTVEKSVNEIKESAIYKNPLFKIMFAGSLIPRKGYDILIDALKINKASGLRFQADFYCLQENELEIAEKIKKDSDLGLEINLLPFLPNKELRKQINGYDLFILPSRHDGWGAVINESLSEGTPVVVSSKCGSSTLINNSFLGNTIDVLDKNKLAETLSFYIRKGKLDYAERLQVREWYDTNVSGESLVKYFMDVLGFINNVKIESKPIVPWER